MGRFDTLPNFSFDRTGAAPPVHFTRGEIMIVKMWELLLWKAMQVAAYVVIVASLIWFASWMFGH